MALTKILIPGSITRVWWLKDYFRQLWSDVVWNGFDWHKAVIISIWQGVNLHSNFASLLILCSSDELVFDNGCLDDIFGMEKHWPQHPITRSSNERQLWSAIWKGGACGWTVEAVNEPIEDSRWLLRWRAKCHLATLISDPALSGGTICILNRFCDHFETDCE